MRRLSTVTEVSEIAEVPRLEVEKVVEVFTAQGVNFLVATPTASTVSFKA